MLAQIGLTLALALSAQLATLTASNSSETIQRLPRLFDFEGFQRTFHKHYDSPTEEFARRAYFIGRAIKVYVSAVSYYYRRADYHLSINTLSDTTPAERELMANHALDGGTSWKNQSRLMEQDERLQLGDADLRRLLERLVRDHPQDSVLLKRMLEQANTRVRRSALATDQGQRTQQVREFPLEELFSTGAGVELAAEARKRFRNRVASNNEHYQPLELMSGAISKEIKALNELQFPIPEVDTYEEEHAYMKKARRGLRESIEQRKSSGELVEHPTFELADRDKLIIDHSRMGCMNLPQSQGKCGACYIFAGVTLYEWLYCKKTGHLVRFSEQYILDCGQKFMHMSGCQGGTFTSAAQFAPNFGLELASNYPYLMQNGQCPIEEKVDLKTTGYIRFQSNDAFSIPSVVWQEYLQFGPIVVGIMTGKTNFHDYGRGVHELVGCDETGGHSMVLVGHGVFNGRKYWKIRNSHGLQWGEDGYYRVYKDSSCIRDWGVVFSTSDGQNYDLSATVNAAYTGVSQSKKRARQQAASDGRPPWRGDLMRKMWLGLGGGLFGAKKRRFR